MTSAPTIRTALFVTCVFASAAGCGSTSKQPAKDPLTTTTPDASAANTDPCAMRLHDICAPLLLYYATNHALPARLEQLSQVPGFESVTDFTCPASGKPYVYNPAGIPAPDRAMRLIIYDAVSAHAGVRWAVSIPATPSEGPLVVKVVAVPEARFSK